MTDNEYIDIYEHLFAEAGWKELMKDLNEKRTHIAIQLMDGKDDIDRVWFLRGLSAAYKDITNWEASIELAKQQNKGEFPDVAQ